MTFELGAGGTSIEDLAEKYPEKIIKIPVDIFEGITDEQATQMVEGLQINGDKQAAVEQIKALYKCFTDSDCTMVEVSRTLLARSWDTAWCHWSMRCCILPGKALCLYFD